MSNLLNKNVKLLMVNGEDWFFGENGTIISFGNGFYRVELSNGRAIRVLRDEFEVLDA